MGEVLSSLVPPGYNQVSGRVMEMADMRHSKCRARTGVWIVILRLRYGSCLKPSASVLPDRLSLRAIRYALGSNPWCHGYAVAKRAGIRLRCSDLDRTE